MADPKSVREQRTWSGQVRLPWDWLGEMRMPLRRVRGREGRVRASSHCPVGRDEVSLGEDCSKREVWSEVRM